MAKYIMALDAGTTSNRCIIFNRSGDICSMSQKEFTQYFPKPGWVEHDAEEIWHTMYSVVRETMNNITALEWDEELCDILEIPRSILPDVRPSSGKYGDTDVFGGDIKIAGVAGDQQAALFGQACFEPGEAKNTYGTGCFMLMNTGNAPVYSKNELLTTIAWGVDGEVTYALEGSVYVAGAAIQWLRDEMRFIDTASETEYYAKQVHDTNGCYVVH